MLAAALAAAFDGERPQRLGIAVSGGGDSMALMVLLSDWARGGDVRLHVASVDHGLRPEAADEARGVGAHAARLGLPCDLLRWEAGAVAGNLQAAARGARYGLLANWAAGLGIGHVCLGHTTDDQAETVLLRLARGSGVTGLSAMAPISRRAGVTWLRPLLEVSRADLRTVLAARGIGWVEDPANEDTRFDRIKARRMLQSPPLPGLDAATLVATAARMRAAERVLGRAAAEAAARLARVEGGDLLLDAAGLMALPDETRSRCLAEAVRIVAQAPYRPRLATLLRAEAAIAARRRITLHGCLVSVRRGVVRVCLEPGMAARATAAVPGIWDRRWQVDGPASEGGVPVEIRALGEAGLALLASPPPLPRATLLAAPAVWRGGDLCAAPASGHAGRWTARPIWGKLDYLDALFAD